MGKINYNWWNDNKIEKQKYCPTRQYMLKKLVKWGIKVWGVADSSSKYVCNFYIYTSAPRGGKVVKN
jgi:hypothetical protein